MATEKKKGYSAHAKYLRISASKVRRIADEIRRKPYT
jgi:ribosomal protein L22